MRNQGVGSWAARRARMSPERVAVVHDGREFTYREVAARVTRAAHLLAAHGIGPGDRVAYLGPNHPTLLEALLATGAVGGAFVPLNTRLAAPELAYILRDSGAAALIWSPRLSDVVSSLNVPIPYQLSLDGYEAALSTMDPEPIDLPVEPAETCMIMYTSGTTGRPKGVMLTHANVTWNTMNLLIDVDVTTTEVTLVSAPMFHVAALNQTVLPTFCKGGTAILMSAFDPDRTLELIERHGVTFLFGVPAMFQAIALSPRWAQADLSSVRSAICGGAPVPEPLIATYRKRGVTLQQGYGLTESAPGATFLRAADSPAKAGSAGTASFFTDVRLAGPNGAPIPPHEPGEVQINGPNVMAGYWGLPTETADTLTTDGWLRTGDIAIADDEGYLYIRDRIKDLIISGGENIYPAEVEDVIYEHPAVAECAVIGVPDERWGEVGQAIVVLRSGTHLDPADLLAFLDGKIARYKIPKSVVFADGLPRTASGKVLKHLLRGRH